MSCRVFGLEPESVYGEEKTKQQFNLDLDHEVDSMDFKLNDEPVTKSFGSRMNQKSRAGVIKPTGSIETSANLQILGHYFYMFLDNYKFTSGSNKNTHEFWGGERKILKSCRGVSVDDELIFYLMGLLVNSMKLEVSSEDMTLGADFVYKTEFAEILADETAYERVAPLVNDLFIMFYDVSLKLNKNDPAGVQTSFTFEGNNNLDVDKTIGFGYRHPQGQAKANKRENSISIVTTLTQETVRAILDARYGDVGAVKPAKCKILQVPLQVDVELCEYPGLGLTIVFPKCTLLAEFDSSGIDDVEATLNMATLGSDTVEIVTANGSTTTPVDAENKPITTDMYVKLVNNMPEIAPRRSVGRSLDRSISYDDVPETVDVQIRVTDGENPIGQVEVSIDDITGTTGNAGGCTLRNVAVGEHVITASKEGYETYSQTVEVSFEDEITIEMTKN